MKITGGSGGGRGGGGEAELPKITSSKDPNPDLLQSSRKPPRRKVRSSGGGVRWRKDVSGGAAGRRSRPQTPLLRWKFNEDLGDSNGCVAEEDDDECSSELGRRRHRKNRASVSARKLAAGIWRLQLPEVPNGEKLGFQGGVGQARISSYGHYRIKPQDSPVHNTVNSPCSVSGPRNGMFLQHEAPFQFSNTAMEGATKWDPISWKAAEGKKQIPGAPKVRDKQTSTPRVVSVLEAELEQARARINELETEQQSYKKKLEQFLKKLSEERASWRSREHEKIRVILDDMKAELTREKKNRQRLEIVNSKLVNELADAKLAAKSYMQDYEKERKARELIEEVCDELAKEIGEDKAEVEVLKRESERIRDEVDEERKMLQMAEVWREERVQMKLIDAKLTLEEKYSQMNKLTAEIESFLSSKGATFDMEEMKKMEQLRQLAASVDIHDIREFTYDPTNQDDIFSVFEDTNEKQVEPHVQYTISPDVNIFQKASFHRHPKAYANQSDDYEEEGSEWETVSHLDEQGSSYSPNGSDPSVNNACDETPMTDITEVCSTPTQPLKKTSSISRFWRYSNGRLSNGAIMSSDGSSSKDGLSPSGQLKGCIEWPRNSLQKNSLKSKLMEARLETQKIQLKHVLKQKF